MDGSVVIRRSHAGDLESYWRCLDTVARERRWLALIAAPPLEDTRKFLGEGAQQGMVQFLAVAGDDVVGWCDAWPARREGFRHSAELGTGLLASYRNQGIGSAMLAHTLQGARDAGLTRIELTVYETNQAAIALYRKHGFVEEGRRRRARVLDGRVDDMICMALLF